MKYIITVHILVLREFVNKSNIKFRLNPPVRAEMLHADRRAGTHTHTHTRARARAQHKHTHARNINTHARARAQQKQTHTHARAT